MLNKTNIAHARRPLSVAVTRCGLLTGLVMISNTGTQALAQSVEQTALEEVVVTATKRGEQRLQDIPVAVQALNANQIRSQVATELSELAPQISSLVVQDLGPGDREYIIRGVNSTATATVGVYYDEAVITARSKQDGGGRQADIELHDLARVEVLKGPQGTLYGASSMSGTVRYIPNRPDTQQFEANIGGTLSTTEDGGDNFQVNGMLNLPVIKDVLALRAVGWTTDEDGFIDNTLLGNKDINDNQVDGGKLAFEWAANDQLLVSGFALRQDREVGGTSRQMPVLQQTFAENQAAFAGALAASGFGMPAAEERTVQSYTITDWDEELELYSGKFEWTHAKGNLLGAISKFERAVDFNFDSTPILLSFGVPVPAITAQPQKREVTNAELRWSSNFDGPVQLLLGGFVSEEDKDFVTQVIASGPDGRPLAAFEPGDPNSIFGRSKSDTVEQQAVFSEVEYRLNEHWTVLAGARWYSFDIDSENQELQPFGGTPSEVPTEFSVDDDQVTGKFNITYTINDGALVYATWSQGYRPGGTNDVAFIPPGTPVPPAGFGPDELDNWELGWKLTLLDNRVTVNGAVYYIDWQDIQVSSFDANSPFEVVRNEGEAEVTGIEFDIQARPMPGLDLSLAASFQEAEYASEIPGSSPESPFARDGQSIPNVPDFQLGASAQYRWTVAGTMEASARLAYSYMDDRLTQPNDPVANVPLDSFSLLSARLGLESDTWNVALFGKNLLDEDNAAVDGINTNQDPRAIITARPRTIGLQFQYRFDG